MDILITGSVAYDYLMTFPGHFREHILPERLESISLSFLVDSMSRKRGGIAPNIAYTMSLLGYKPRVMATVGEDFSDYRNWLESKGQVNAEEFWTFIWYNSAIKATPIDKQEKWHYFSDHEVVYWRSSWDDDATAFAFKAGPPEGHAAAAKLKLFPDWRLSTPGSAGRSSHWSSRSCMPTPHHSRSSVGRGNN